jgi:hypothetical protein
VTLHPERYPLNVINQFLGKEKPIITITKKCLNTSCQNYITKYDMGKIGNKFSWNRFCILCRTTKTRITGINCQECNKLLPFITSGKNVMKIYCVPCGEKRHRE